VPILLDRAGSDTAGGVASQRTVRCRPVL